MKYKNCFSSLIILIFVSSVFTGLKVEATPVIGSTTTTTLYPIMDVYVNETSPDTNYGNSEELNVKFNSYRCYVYLMFDLSSIPSEMIFISATLRVYASAGSWEGPFGMAGVGVHYSPDNTWTEEGITWNNKPAFEDEETDRSSFGRLSYTGYKSWNVTDDVKVALSEGKLTEVLKFDSGNAGHIRFRSRETSSQPELMVEYSTEPIYDVHVESVQDTGDTSNLGYIMIDENFFTLPNDVSVVPGSYPVSYQGGYEFVEWETTGDISISNPDSQNTTLTVSGSGILRAVGNAETMVYAYDDGSPSTGTSKRKDEMVAVRFTTVFQGELEKARFYVRYVSDNVSENVVKVHVMGENRQDIISPFSTTFNSEGWFDVDLSGYDIEINSDFYVGIEWTTDYSPDIGADYELHGIEDRQWKWDGTEWSETYTACMIRAKVRSYVPVTVLPSPTPQPTPTPTPTYSPTPTPSTTATPTPTPTYSPTPTPSTTATPTPTPTYSPTPTPTLTPKPTPTPSFEQGLPTELILIGVVIIVIVVAIIAFKLGKRKSSKQ